MAGDPGQVTLHVSEERGNDEQGTGTQDQPYRTLVRACRHALDQGATAASYMVYDNEQQWQPASKAGVKKAVNAAKTEITKLQKQRVREAEDSERREKNLEEAKRLTIEDDPSLPRPQKAKVRDLTQLREKRVAVCGWIDALRKEGTNLWFILLRDGTGYLQAVLSDKLCRTYNALTLSTEASVCLYGVVKELPAGKTAPGNHEMQVDYWELIGSAPPGGIDNLLNESSHPDVLLDNRHMHLRCADMSKIMKLRSVCIQSFRKYYEENGFFEVTPPTLVQTQVEGGSTLFKMRYFEEDAYLTQSSQLYLETAIPAMGDVYCIAQSYRAENSRTRRHLAEYTHVEGERPFITFTELLDHLEDLICGVAQRMLDSPHADLLKQLNPNFKIPERPFMRMDYTEAISWLNEHGIKKEEDGSDFAFGDDIPEKPERHMTDTIGRPIMLIRFPAAIKSFYMPRDRDDNRVTESVDVLMPNVGEIVGGSMRTWKYDELVNGFKTNGLDPAAYYWYMDLRKYGTCPHGGYGLGLERLLTWILDRPHIRDCTMYPRFVGRCKP